MGPEQLAADMIEICRLGWQRGYLAGGQGNLSARLDDERILITPSGRSKALLTPEDLVQVSLSGEVLAGAGKPSGELPLHLAAYRLRPEVGAVLHAHPTAATALSLAGRQLDCTGLPEMLYHLGAVPTVPYAAPSSQDNAAAAEPFIKEHRALLLAHHGSLCLGRELEEVLMFTELVEQAARTLLAAGQLGGARPLPSAEQERLRRVDAEQGDELPSLAQRLDKVHLGLSPEFKVEKRAQDDRGRVHLILDGVLAQKVSLLHLEPGTGFRGGHHHHEKTEWFYVAAGRCQAEFVCSASGERLVMELLEGDRVRIPPGVAHRFEAIEPLTFVEIANRPYQAEDDLSFDWERS